MMTSVVKERGPYPIVVVSTVTPENGTLQARQHIREILHRYGMLAFLVDGSMPRALINASLQLASGLLIPGGADIHSRYYQEKLHPKSRPTDPKRDRLEAHLLRQADLPEYNLPFLGICRGFQMFWIIKGGKMVQWLPDVTTQKHGRPDQVYAHLDDEAAIHPVFLVPGTLAYELLSGIADGNMIPLTSMHNQAPLAGTTDRAIVSGEAEDGVVEIGEGAGERFEIGFQGHIERPVFPFNRPKRKEDDKLHQVMQLTMEAFKRAVDERAAQRR